MPSQYYIKRGDKVNGPFRSGQIKNGIKSKKIKPGDLLGSSDIGPWKEVRSIIKVTSDHNDKSKVSGSNDDLGDLSSFGGALPDPTGATASPSRARRK